MHFHLRMVGLAAAAFCLGPRLPGAARAVADDTAHRAAQSLIEAPSTPVSMPYTKRIPTQAPLGHLITFRRGTSPEKRSELVERFRQADGIDNGPIHASRPRKLKSFQTGIQMMLDPGNPRHQQLLEDPNILAVEADAQVAIAASSREVVVLPIGQHFPSSILRVDLDRPQFDAIDRHRQFQPAPTLGLDFAVVDASHPDLNVYRPVSLVGLDPMVDADGHGCWIRPFERSSAEGEFLPVGMKHWEVLAESPDRNPCSGIPRTGLRLGPGGFPGGRVALDSWERGTLVVGRRQEGRWRTRGSWKDK